MSDYQSLAAYIARLWGTGSVARFAVCSYAVGDKTYYNTVTAYAGTGFQLDSRVFYGLTDADARRAAAEIQHDFAFVLLEKQERELYTTARHSVCWFLAHSAHSNSPDYGDLPF